MLNITNQNGVTYTPNAAYRLTDMNGESGNPRSYDVTNMNGMTWADDIHLSITQMNPLRPRRNHSTP